MAAQEGHTAIVQLLLDSGANIDEVKTPEGRTALHEAAYQGNEGLVEGVFKYNPDIDAEDKYGKTPLQLANSRGHIEVVNLLLEKKEDQIKKSIGIKLDFLELNHNDDEKFSNLKKMVNIIDLIMPMN